MPGQYNILQMMKQPTISVYSHILHLVPPWYKTEAYRVRLLFNLSSHQTS